jgi:hypothetical protein
VAVDEQNKAVVGADANRIVGRDSSQRDDAPEMQHNRLAQRRRGMSDPGGLPFVVRRVGLGCALTVKGDGGGDKSEERQNWAHECLPIGFQLISLPQKCGEAGLAAGLPVAVNLEGVDLDRLKE